jgi:hypothetical protein
MIRKSRQACFQVVCAPFGSQWSTAVVARRFSVRRQLPADGCSHSQGSKGQGKEEVEERRSLSKTRLVKACEGKRLKAWALKARQTHGVEGGAAV